jgi:DNA-binding SARP family transcriptional activator
MPTEEFCADLRALGAASPAALPALCEQWEWFQPHGVRIAQLLHSTSMCLANVLIERGRFAEAIDIANALLELDPCDEPAAATAVEAWLRLGNRNQATAACRRYEHALKSSYGDDTSALNLRKMLTSA